MPEVFLFADRNQYEEVKTLGKLKVDSKNDRVDSKSSGVDSKVHESGYASPECYLKKDDESKQIYSIDQILLWSFLILKNPRTS
ncbi:hypothetical protein QUF49_20340 [Fictibacillus sp. b24]|uniref:hypothetical protein n=1 Tax=Fictibacillus sp. b24 TaxID=3055863 RepID=UPI0025A2A3BA|nr:hypothetical protein [Fictibacillus sp. b24]MDM5318336.1 hypothetical protein [Fictibacillus sp. b24]